jgi:hypothetical protein
MRQLFATSFSSLFAGIFGAIGMERLFNLGKPEKSLAAAGLFCFAGRRCKRLCSAARESHGSSKRVVTGYSVSLEKVALRVESGAPSHVQVSYP